MRDKTTALLLNFFLGGIGIHKFYLGRKTAGELYLIFFWTFIPSLLALADFVIMLLMDEETFNAKYNGTN